MKKATFLITTFLIFFQFGFAKVAEHLHCDAVPPLTALFLNELMAANNSIPDEHDETDDWLELYNDNDIDIDLQGLYLSDDPDELTKWKIEESLLISAKGYVIIWLDDQTDQGNNHASFKLKSEGESIYLSKIENGNSIVIDYISFPDLSQNTSYGRATDGATPWVVFSEATPLASNEDGEQVLDASVIFSKPDGVYDDSFELTISCTDPDAEVRWTLDGTTPDLNSDLYTSPISIANTKYIRAKAFKSGNVSTAAADVFYVVKENHDLPVVQIASDPDLLFSDEEGIYVSGANGKLTHCSPTPHNWNQDWEIPATIRFLDTDDSLAFAANAGVKIGGGCSRIHSMKALNVYFRKNTYGVDAIEYPLFEGLKVNRFERLKLRASGTDFPYTRIRDAAVQSILFNQLDIDQMAYRPVALYLNDKYWGFYGLRELFSKHHVAAHHGVDEDNIDMIKIPYSPYRELKAGDFENFDSLTVFFQNNDFEKEEIYQEVLEKIDVNEYINYHIAQIYIANYDWPENNMVVWRDRNNGKWRWMLYDLDWSASFLNGFPVYAEFNAMAHATTTTGDGWPSDAGSTLFLRRLLKNRTFRAEFVQRSCTIAQTVFDPKRTTHFIDSLTNDVIEEMPRTFDRFNDLSDNWTATGDNPGGGSMDSWMHFLEEFKQFFEDRLDYFMSHIKEHFDYEGKFRLDLNVNTNTNGSVVLHENEMTIPFNYSGFYFKNVPIKIKAVPDEGYYFLRWLETGDTTAQLNLTAKESLRLTPLFLRNGTIEQPADGAPFLKLYPNPVDDLLTLSFADVDNSDFEVRIFNALGNKVYEQKLVAAVFAQEQTVDVSDWVSGVYFLKTTIGGEKKVISFVVY